jgi:hypothetical protein
MTATASVSEPTHLDPAQGEAMRAAFQKVCDALWLKCGPDDAITEFVVTKITQLANAGEVDPDRICGQVLIELAEQPGGGRGVYRGHPLQSTRGQV